jgi:hypothetical protein
MLMFSWTEDCSCATFLMPDDDLQCVYQLHISTQPPLPGHGPRRCVDKVGSNDRHPLVIGSARPDAKHLGFPKLLFLLTAREGRLSTDH